MVVHTGGGKAKKPLSVMDKEARKKAKEVPKKPAKEEKPARKTQVELGISDQLIKRASKVISEAKIVTPSSLASALGVKVSLARALIREIVRSGEATLVSKHRGFLIVKSSSS
ncbi:MAG: hypothetical protein QW154_05045 [Sulfolobales archaeon]